jgi:hypothetical protein
MKRMWMAALAALALAPAVAAAGETPLMCLPGETAPVCKQPKKTPLAGENLACELCSAPSPDARFTPPDQRQKPDVQDIAKSDRIKM